MDYILHFAVNVIYKGMERATWCTDSPYLLMEERDMLAEEGILYDEVCLGTKATTQRSDTCVKRRMKH